MHAYMHACVRVIHGIRELHVVHDIRGTHTYIHSYRHTYTHTRMHANIHTYIHIYMHTSLYAHISTCIHTCMYYIQTYINTQVQTRIHTWIHTCITYKYRYITYIHYMHCEHACIHAHIRANIHAHIHAPSNAVKACRRKRHPRPPGARRGVFVAARPRARRILLLQRQGIWAAPGHLGSATPQRVVAVDTGNENVQSKL